ncbi:hypothetical protein ElyMa_006920600 [Elysia marginata]|uniref:Uncharacterized protein n=1 Tax=Elysia marginata TaxID=1093978 RepID=A0AAV4JG17_9GAST|nr:hypothetical protein ElyMa_006920600 [Elysia marginata]
MSMFNRALDLDLDRRGREDFSCADLRLAVKCHGDHDGLANMRQAKTTDTVEKSNTTGTDFCDNALGSLAPSPALMTNHPNEDRYGQWFII